MVTFPNSPEYWIAACPMVGITKGELILNSTPLKLLDPVKTLFPERVGVVIFK